MTPTFSDTDTMNGVVVRRPQRHADGRGHLTEFYRDDEIDEACRPVMGYISVTNPGLSRGPHEHVDQTDIFFFPGPGEFLVALWDNRVGSPTHNRRMVIRAGESNPCVVVIPPGVVHAYSCISKNAGTVVNIPNRLYRGEGKKEPVDEVRHEDNPSNPFLQDLARIVEERRA
jgi:dTDP-4-dehydrorhamnose 3,5-epimerase